MTELEDMLVYEDNKKIYEKVQKSKKKKKKISSFIRIYFKN